MISRKVLSQSFTTFVMAVIAYVATRQGIHLSPMVSGEISGAAAWAGGSFAGWLAREDPALFATPVPPVPAPPVPVDPAPVVPVA